MILLLYSTTPLLLTPKSLLHHDLLAISDIDTFFRGFSVDFSALKVVNFTIFSR